MSQRIKEINDEACKSCGQKIDEKYIIDQEGEQYCSEECMDNFTESNVLSFESIHPYEDQYLSIRREYIDLLENWEQSLSSKKNNLESAVDEMYAEIDEIIEDYYDFKLSEGDDGVYAWEIYQYTHKLENLQQKIFAWRPNRKTYYWVSTELCRYGSNDYEEREMFDKISRALYLDGYGEDILEIIKNYAHPCHWGLNLVFDRNEDALEVYEVLKPYFDKYEQELSLEESYCCEAGCDDIVSNSDESLFVNGWFFCYSHSESGDYGIFSNEELTKEISYFSENVEERQIVIQGNCDWCYPFKEKIKRSCRSYNVQIPSWAI